jgi:hypothetical protein
MVSNIRFGPSLEYQLSLATNGQIELFDIRFKK